MDFKYSNEDLLKLENIERWEFTNELDSAFDQADEEDGDGGFYDYFLPCACPDELILKFVLDSNCLKREYFLGILITHLFRVFKLDGSTPFHTSRLQGIMQEQEFLDAENRRAKEVYRICKIIDELRVSKDPLILALFNKIMDYRNIRFDLLNTSFNDAHKMIHQYMHFAIKDGA